MERLSEIYLDKMFYEATDDEEAKELFFYLRAEGYEHLEELLGLANEADVEVELEEIEQELSKKETPMEPGMTLDDAVSECLINERNCLDFYTRLARSLRNSELDDVDTDRLADSLDRIADEEEEHIQLLKRSLEKRDAL